MSPPLDITLSLMKILWFTEERESLFQRGILTSNGFAQNKGLIHLYFFLVITTLRVNFVSRRTAHILLAPAWTCATLPPSSPQKSFSHEKNNTSFFEKGQAMAFFGRFQVSNGRQSNTWWVTGMRPGRVFRKNTPTSIFCVSQRKLSMIFSFN